MGDEIVPDFPIEDAIIQSSQAIRRNDQGQFFVDVDKDGALVSEIYHVIPVCRNRSGEVMDSKPVPAAVARQFMEPCRHCRDEQTAEALRNYVVCVDVHSHSTDLIVHGVPVTLVAGEAYGPDPRPQSAGNGHYGVTIEQINQTIAAHQRRTAANKRRTEVPDA